MKKSWFVIAAALPLVLVGSIAVWQLSGDGTRRIGALGPLKESMPLAWRGDWSSEMRYVPGEVVAYKGAAYVAEREPDTSPGDCPSEDCAWVLVAAQGAKGEPGPQGPAGPKGPQGEPGSGSQATPEAWHEVTTWPVDRFTNAGGNLATVAFYKDPIGRVHLKGTAKAKVATSAVCHTIFFLPEGYRPTAARVFVAVKNALNAPSTAVVVANGEHLSACGGMAVDNTISLDGVSFRAD